MAARRAPCVLWPVYGASTGARLEVVLLKQLYHRVLLEFRLLLGQMERCTVLAWTASLELALLPRDDLGPIGPEGALVLAVVDLHSEQRSRPSLGPALLNLPSCLVHISDGSKVTSLRHAPFDLGGLPALLHSLHDLVHSLDLNYLGGNGVVRLVDLWLEFAFVTLALVPIVIRLFVLLVLQFRSIEQILVPVTRRHLVAKLRVQIIHFLVGLGLERQLIVFLGLSLLAQPLYLEFLLPHGLVVN